MYESLVIKIYVVLYLMVEFDLFWVMFWNFIWVVIIFMYNLNFDKLILYISNKYNKLILFLFIIFLNKSKFYVIVK